MLDLHANTLKAVHIGTSKRNTTASIDAISLGRVLVFRVVADQSVGRHRVVLNSWLWNPSSKACNYRPTERVSRRPSYVLCKRDRWLWYRSCFI